MSQPTTYVRAFNFTNQQAVTPSDPLRADKVDLEYNLIKTSLDETQANLALIQRDDGAVANASIGYDQLKDEVEIGVNPPTAWTTLHNYIVRDTVTQNAAFYRCLVSHISGVFATDLAAGKWELIADFASAISATSIATAIHAAPNKTDIVDADEIGGLDSADSYTLRHFTWANIKATMFTAWGALLAAATAKTTPVGADVILLSDSAAANATKSLSFTNLQEWVRTKLGAMVSANSAKTTPVDADQILLSDSAASSGPAKLSWLNLVTAMFTRIGPAIAAATAKAAPVDADSILLSDSAASDANKKVTIANLKAMILGGFTNAFALPGMQVQRVVGTYALNTDITATIPFDDTIPQNSEGQSLIAVSITPRSATNIIVARFEASGSMSAVGNMIAALFRAGFANSFGSNYVTVPTAGYVYPLVVEAEVVAGVTTSLAFEVRVGSTGTMRFNGTTAVRLFGGAMNARLVLTEIKV